MSHFVSTLLATLLLSLVTPADAKIAPAYDGKYHGVWYPIGQVKTPFAKTDGRLFNVNGKTQYLTGANAWWVPRLRNNSDIDLVFDQIANSGLKIVRSWAYATFNYTPPGPYESIYASWFQLINNTGTYVNYGATGLAQLDYVVHSAEKHNLFLVLPLVDYNGGAIDPDTGKPDLTNDLGGIDLYENVFGCNETLWYTAPACQNAYRSYVETIVTRYKSSPAIFAWEIMNEPRCHYANKKGCDPAIITKWASDTSAWVKSLDPNHMVTLGEEGWFTPKDGYGDGTYAYQGVEGTDFVANLAIPTLDYDTVHCYPDAYGYQTTWGSTWIKQHDAAGAKAKKPVVIEEYGATAQVGVLGWQNTIVKDTKIALDIFWDFVTLTSESSPRGPGIVYSDDASIFYNDTANYKKYVRNHAKAMLNKKVT